MSLRRPMFQIAFLFSALLIGLPSEASKVYFKQDPLSNKRLSSVTKNPEEQKFDGQTVYRFQIQHGGCGEDGYWSDCNNDRQRVELKDGYKVSLQTWSKEKNLERYYRTNLLIPDEEMFPITAPMTQMIHQTKLKSKNNPIWMVHIDQRGGLRISTDSAGGCIIDKEFLPRGKWLEIEIHTNYELYSSEKLELAEEAYLQSRNSNYAQKVKPSFRYFINGKELCTLWKPLITKAGLRDGGEKKLQLKFGIYNTFPSKWLLAQVENQRWIQQNNIKFSGYQQDSKGERNGAVSSKIASPFDYDWPVKLPTQMLYYTDWYMTKEVEKLPASRFEKVKEKTKPEGCSDPIFANMMGSLCN
ncbi:MULTISPECIES: heparin lyase I family protein [unclassified Marinobacterium]|uniref:heparin lyase I family protein n=1 Tax=unclassified Marinobacterium TaxID=2644139 RepID=UPI001569085D|nr:MULTISPECIES: heparin lyase I family protein [unclassified Marinobacterium]NRP53650.1 hypothetical protein [Marinobacterium sp. xm-v-242]NRP78148.1 hypothetical protein [Marinobacterium sp. xm-m-383]